ncbi:MAG TPA: MarP family serine protease [Acidimicrobiales bacterium]|nr:MarP family serine protease [Acidimicrobiales bacterium]
MNWVDYVLLVIVALSGIHGLRLGAATQVLSFGGFWLGLFIGALVAPSLAGLASGTTAKTLVALVVLIGVATILGAVGRLLGVRSSRFLQRLRLGPLDSAFGVAVAVVATLIATWLVASLLSDSRYPSLARAVQQSRIVRALDHVLPPIPTVFTGVQRFLAQNGFPVVFAGLPPEVAGPVTLPSDAAERAAVVRAEPSTVQVAGQGCGVIQEGSGFVAAPGLVVTNAHVVAGIAAPVVIDGTGRHPATAAVFDPQLDVAVLRVPGLADPALPIDATIVARGTTGVVLGYPEGGPFTYGKAGVAASFKAVGLDIYGKSTTTRQIYQLDATVNPGNSGGPIVSSGDAGIPDGTVIGVVFARSTTYSGVGYALAMPAVVTDIAQAQARVRATDGSVGTGACLSS